LRDVFIAHASGTSYAPPLIARVLSWYMLIYDVTAAVANYQAHPNRDTAERCRVAGRKLAALSDEELSLALSDEDLVALHNLFTTDEDLQ
jgi:hypothetical protein